MQRRIDFGFYGCLIVNTKRAEHWAPVGPGPGGGVQPQQESGVTVVDSVAGGVGGAASESRHRSLRLLGGRRRRHWRRWRRWSFVATASGGGGVLLPCRQRRRRRHHHRRWRRCLHHQVTWVGKVHI
jgi:hypothetical protein